MIFQLRICLLEDIDRLHVPSCRCWRTVLGVGRSSTLPLIITTGDIHILHFESVSGVSGFAIALRATGARCIVEAELVWMEQESIGVGDIKFFLLFLQRCLLLVELQDKPSAQALLQLLMFLVGDCNIELVVFQELINAKVVTILGDWRQQKPDEG